MRMALFGFTLVRVEELKSLRARARPAEQAPPIPAAKQASLARTEEAANGPAEETPPRMASEIIRLADQLPDLLRDGAIAGSGQADDTVRWLDQRVQALLASCDVVRVEDAGSLDFSRHEVTGTRPAPDTSAVNHIAATIRPGYSWHGRMLRPQQVIAYVPAEPDIIRDEET
jgi:molecular chaperone GrpE (heat shock protein)